MLKNSKAKSLDSRDYSDIEHVWDELRRTSFRGDNHEQVVIHSIDFEAAVTLQGGFALPCYFSPLFFLVFSCSSSFSFVLFLLLFFFFFSFFVFQFLPTVIYF